MPADERAWLARLAEGPTTTNLYRPRSVATGVAVSVPKGCIRGTSGFVFGDGLEAGSSRQNQLARASDRSHNWLMHPWEGTARPGDEASGPSSRPCFIRRGAIG